MTNKLLLDVVHKIYGDQTDQYHLLTPDSTANELRNAEVELGTPLFLTITTLLSVWTEQGSEAILTTLPHLLNPTATDAELEPTGKSMRELFPTFCTMLDNTEEFGVVFNSVDYRKANILLIGVGEQLITGRPHSKYWASYLPNKLTELQDWEGYLGFRLSPQMRQLLLRIHGSTESALPYLLKLGWWEKGLLSDLYQDFWHEMDSQEPFERLERFITIFFGGSGDDQGFFYDQVSPNGEYTIYEWDHEQVKFTPTAPDFASWLERILMQGY